MKKIVILALQYKILNGQLFKNKILTVKKYKKIDNENLSYLTEPFNSKMYGGK